MKKKACIFSAALLPLALGLSMPVLTSVPAQAAPVAQRPLSGLSYADKEQTISFLVVEKVNAYRKANGLAALPMVDTLNGYARSWSEQMRDSGVFKHDPDFARMPADMKSGFWMENIAALGDSDDLDAIASRLTQMWIDSEGHNAGLLNPEINSFGVGIAFSSGDRLYGTIRGYKITSAGGGHAVFAGIPASGLLGIDAQRGFAQPACARSYQKVTPEICSNPGVQRAEALKTNRDASFPLAPQPVADKPTQPNVEVEQGAQPPAAEQPVASAPAAPQPTPDPAAETEQRTIVADPVDELERQPVPATSASSAKPSEAAKQQAQPFGHDLRNLFQRLLNLLLRLF